MVDNFKIDRSDRVSNSEKVFYTPGDLVIVKHGLENRPVMLVKGKVQKLVRNDDNNNKVEFLGIKCIWFNKNQELQEAVFNTKDLVYAESSTKPY